ncbi:hypothetical protein SSP531S_30230 [Streptomyces spongiicola]|uniref:Uncharacterized protein n=1 Tax=Streptomyces spongiicola TaxID=1690221 RepID=A0A388SY43_9ACTN|nr:hypothetical protein [Streptomyces spongiicola]GBQ01583.1 hypothetical protein SSP531S_30230 [Streptomyces spongiicola]
MTSRGESRIAVATTATSSITAAEIARRLHRSPWDHLGGPPVAIVHHPPEATRMERREAFREVYGPIVAAIGEPTLYGGSALGPSVRWRDADRLVLLSGDRFHVTLSVHRPEELEGGEYRCFTWGGAWSKDRQHDFDLLPYSWQLYRGGPGESPWRRPDHRLAGDWEQLESALELLLAAWAEQLPVQVPGDWAGFTVVADRDPGRDLVVSYSPGEGLGVAIDDRDAKQCPERDWLMRQCGWHGHDRGWWHSAFPEAAENSPTAAARLAVTELRSRGALGPQELSAREAGVDGRGELWLPGLGIRT